MEAPSQNQRAAPPPGMDEGLCSSPLSEGSTVVCKVSFAHGTKDSEDKGDAREQSCRGSAARLKYNARKRERREERNSLVSALDQVLPHDVRSCDFRGAGTRSAGLLGRSITNVLADTVEYLKTLKEEDRSWPQGGARKRTSSPVKYRDGETISHGRPVRPAVLTPWRNAAACEPSSRARH